MKRASIVFLVLVALSIGLTSCEKEELVETQHYEDCCGEQGTLPPS